MVDSGASTTFIHRRFVKENNIETIALRRARDVYNVDGTINKAGRITAAARLEMHIGDHSEVVVFTITDTGRDNVIIGLDWLRQHNPAVDWENVTTRILGEAEAKPEPSIYQPEAEARDKIVVIERKRKNYKGDLT